VDDLIYYLGDEAVCFFDFTLFKGIWHVKILLINEVSSETKEPYLVPYSAISFKDDPGEIKKTSYLSDHLRFLDEKQEREEYFIFQKTKKPIDKRLVYRNRDLEKRLVQEAIRPPNTN